MIDTESNSHPDEMIQEITLANHSNPVQKKSNLETFYKGLYCLHRNQLSEAKKHLKLALKGSESIEHLHARSLSFLGLVEVLDSHSNGGLHRCYEAEQQCSGNPEFHLNIAYAEYMLGNRQRCVSAIEKCLRHSPDHSQANHFFNCIGKRTRAQNSKNIFGKLMRKKKSHCNGERLNQLIQKNLAIKLDRYVEKVIHQK